MNAARNGPSAQKPADADEEPGAAAKALSNILERGARVQAPAVEAYVQRLRRANPGASPAEIITKLEKRYLAAVMASGAAVGSAAAFPGIGTITALSAVAGETVVFLEATALFVLAVAEVHGIPAGHREHRRALVLSVLVILGLVVGVRVVRKTEDITSTLIAVAVGALVTLGPLALLQSG